MRCKHRWIVLLLAGLAALFSGCGKKEIPDAYDAALVDDALLHGPELSDYKAEGFAADLCVPEEGASYDVSGVNAASFGLFDRTGETVVSAQALTEKRYPASTTKIMTCLLALEMCGPDEIVTVPKDSAITVSGSSMANLRPGDQIRMGDLLYALMVPSGNDAAVAVAHHISGTESAFAGLMNRRAKALGAVHTHFVNAHGLPDEDHYTTVYDMYLIFNEALKHEEFRKISTTPKYSAAVTGADGQKRNLSWTCGNGFLNGNYSLPDGMQLTGGKTGHTNAAGFCLVIGEKEPGSGSEYISIVYKAPAYEALYSGMQELIRKKNG